MNPKLGFLSHFDRPMIGRRSPARMIPMRGKIDCFGQTDIGKVRDTNEDQFLIADLNKSMLIHQTSLSHEDHTRLFGGSQGQLLLVADGMGGHAAGKQASTIAVQSLAHYVLNIMPWFFRLQGHQENDLIDELKAALEEGQKSIENAVAGHAERRGMGTTLTMAYISWPRLYVVHAGDSRCYLFRTAKLEQITTDHTMAQKLVEHGVLPPEQVRESRWSHVLWNCLGGGSHELSAEVYKAQLRVGDILLLCTDGLTIGVQDDQIRTILGQPRQAEETCRALVDAANEAGGRDNITVVVAHFRSAHKQAAKAQLQEALPGELDSSPPLHGSGIPQGELVGEGVTSEKAGTHLEMVFSE
jgi:protein phosphatase